MARPLIVPWRVEFVDLVMDLLGDVEVTVAQQPTEQQWREAPLVIVDLGVAAVLDRMPAHPDTVVAITGLADHGSVVRMYDQLTSRFPHAKVLQLPLFAEELRTRVAQAARAGDRRGVRIGVVGGHGGAGATTLAVALAAASARAGRETLLIDGDPLGGGIENRIRGSREGLRVMGWESPERVDETGSIARVLDRQPGDVKVIDLSRTLDGRQLAAAVLCDVVLVVADVAANRFATRRVLTTLREAGVSFVLVGRSDVDHSAYLLAGDFTAPESDGMPPFPMDVDRDGAIDVTRDSALLEFAVNLLADVPELRLEAAA